MSADQPAGDAAPYVQLFQKAHQKIVMLERIDEQMGQMLAKRQELQEELRAIQAQINEEFDARLKDARDSLGRLHATIAIDSKRSSQARFAAQAIESVA